MKNNRTDGPAGTGRRRFLKQSAAATAGLAAAYLVNHRPASAAQASWPDGSVLTVNPDIDNLRVVNCEDSDMVTNRSATSYTTQSAGTDTGLVATNMDKMAMALAQKATAAEAWQTIFRKPDTKEWSDVKVGIKVNTQGSQNIPRYAVVVKVCRALVNHCGVTGSNICLFDSSYISHSQNQTGVSSSYGANTGTYPFPTGVQFNSDLFSGSKSTVEVPASGAAVSPVNCLADLVDGTVDILISIATNKGHYQAGQVTLTQKNHIGTLKFFCPGKTSTAGMPGSYTTGSAEDLVALNKCAAIAGGTPVRQQLCIVDSLWASSALHPVTAPDSTPYMISMGVFGGAVDYMVTKKIREDVMGVDPSSSYSNYTADQNHFITGYGYSDTERSNLTGLAPDSNDGKGWVDALTWTPATSLADQGVAAGTNRPLSVSLRSGGAHVKTVLFSIPRSEQLTGGGLFSVAGRQVSTLAPGAAAAAGQLITWDMNSPARGQYVMLLTGKQGSYTAKVMIR